jgi:hypothetical protein
MAAKKRSHIHIEHELQELIIFAAHRLSLKNSTT